MENNYSPQELEQSLIVLTSLLHKCKKSQENITLGTSQHTLLTNRIKALEISITLIHKEITKK